MHAVNHYPDAELVQDIMDEQKLNAAIHYIFKTHYGLLENMVLNNSGSVSDAEDIIQDALVAFVETIRKGMFRGDASIKSYLYSITYNLWISELRKRGSTAKRNLHFEKEKGVMDEGLLQYLGYKDAQKLVTGFLETLGDKCKEILLLVYYDNMPMKEIIKRFDYQNEQVLRNKKHKCMKELEKRLNESPAISQELKNSLLNGI